MGHNMLCKFRMADIASRLDVRKMPVGNTVSPGDFGSREPTGFVMTYQTLQVSYRSEVSESVLNLVLALERRCCFVRLPFSRSIGVTHRPAVFRKTVP